jgi:uncharacterized protein (TIGR02594 family)
MMLGFDPGVIDGIYGRNTARAIKAYQMENGLPMTGVVDTVLVRALFANQNLKAVPPWIVEGERVRGLHEKRDHKRLWDWLRSDGATLGDPAKLPWCGDFVQTCILKTLPDEPVPNNPYLAANWTKFGKPTKPQLGAVLVFWRGSPSSWKGHVGFCAGQDDTHFLVLGGNQSNSISHSRIAKKRLRSGGCRWPSTFTDPGGTAQNTDLSGVAVTVNEA